MCSQKMRAAPTGAPYDQERCSQLDTVATRLETALFMTFHRADAESFRANRSHDVEHLETTVATRFSQGAAVTWTALTGRVVQCGESQWPFPHKPPTGESHDAQGLLLRRVSKASTCPASDS